MKKLLLLLLLSLGFIGSSYADYQDGVNAYAIEDYATAMKEFKLAAEQGDSKSQYKLGLMHYWGIGELRYDWQSASKWILKSAEQGHREAQYRIGFMYQYGEGVLKDYKKAVKWFTKSAKQNYGEAQLSMAFMNIYGDGTPKDFSKAKFWTRKAFENPESSSKTKNRAESYWNTFELWEY